jgi:hypothetical protein
MDKKGIFIIFLILVSGISGPVTAHPPSGMDIHYDPGTGQLVVVIDHLVQNPGTHYIRSVTLANNKGPQQSYQYTSQPSADRAAYRFDIPAGAGDPITVSATCNLFGSLEKTVPVPSTETPAMAPVGEKGGVSAAVTAGRSSQGISPSSLWPVHAVLMVIGAIVLLGAAGLAARKQIRGWYRHHRFLGATGSLLVVAGIGSAVIMVSWTGGPHLRVVHGALGVVTISLLALVLAVGFTREQIRKGDPWMRKIHIWAAAAAIVMLVLNVISGLAMTVTT